MCNLVEDPELTEGLLEFLKRHVDPDAIMDHISVLVCDCGSVYSNPIVRITQYDEPDWFADYILYIASWSEDAYTQASSLWQGRHNPHGSIVNVEGEPVWYLEGIEYSLQEFLDRVFTPEQASEKVLFRMQHG